MKIKGNANNFIRFYYTTLRGEQTTTQTDLENNFLLLNIDETKEITIESVPAETLVSQSSELLSEKFIVSYFYTDNNEMQGYAHADITKNGIKDAADLVRFIADNNTSLKSIIILNIYKL